VGRDSGGESAGRRARFERIYAAGYEPVMAFALRRTATPEDAADVVAETFLTAWRRLDRLPDPPESRLWLYATARRVLANQRRGQRRSLRLVAKLRGAVPDPPGGASGDRDTSLIAAAFGRLRPADREVLTLAG
jgi:RNA polymerase sigma-70 factor, ECF subfamily